MRPLNYLAIVFTTITTPALSEHALDQSQLSALVTGNTLYVTMPAGVPGAPEGGIAPIYYGKDGSAVALLPAGLKLIGIWKMSETGYCIDWENGPKNSCSTIARSDESFEVKDVATGAPRGQVFTIATGNPENL
ncbi:hypothetical protein ACS3SW_10540 [Roseobacteraceae bacterium S113]